MLVVTTTMPRSGRFGHIVSWFIPNGGTLLIVAILLMTQSLWARPFQAITTAPGPSATTVNYQGRLADNTGAPLDGTYGMSFALYDAVTDGNLIWGPEAHTAVPVSDGLFSVGLGSQTSGGIPTTTWNGDRYLEIIVGGETLTPRELIRSVPVAGMALTVPDGAITVDKLGSTATGKWIMFDVSQLVGWRNGSDFDWEVVDLSNVVPPSASIAYLTIYFKETVGNGWCAVRPYRSTSNGGSIQARSTLANVYASEQGMVAINEAKIEYKCGWKPDATTSDMGIDFWGYYEPGY
ncbi:MAG: hypothetical protein JXA33_25750 [Anaerolineae bacterium]|nr:hypothetical protein [Anaerolineae bacterium]